MGFPDERGDDYLIVIRRDSHIPVKSQQGHQAASSIFNQKMSYLDALEPLAEDK